MAVGKRALAAALGVVLLSLVLPGVIADDAQLPLAIAFLLALPLGLTLGVLGSLLDTLAHRLVARWPLRVGLLPALGLGALVVTLLLVGAGRRALASDTFDVANPDAVQHARVTLAAGVRGALIPCDFLAWEYQGWECASHERGVTLTGLATATPERIGPDGVADLHLSTNSRGRLRSIAFDDVLLTDHIELWVRLAEPSAQTGTLQVLLGDHVVHEVTLEALIAEQDAHDQTHVSIDTRAQRGQRVTLSLRLSAPRQGAAVWLHGGPR